MGLERYFDDDRLLASIWRHRIRIHNCHTGGNHSGSSDKKCNSNRLIFPITVKNLFTCMSPPKSKRRYYAADPGSKTAYAKRGYLVRWYCVEKDAVMADGPYESIEKSIDEQNQKLLAGICSWLVPYDG